MGALGLMNSISIYQGWISTRQLATHSSSQIAWTFGLYWNVPSLSLRDPSWTDLRRQGAPVVNVAQLAARPANIRADGGLHRLLAFPSHHRHHGPGGDIFYLPRACGEYWAFLQSTAWCGDGACAVGWEYPARGISACAGESKAGGRQVCLVDEDYLVDYADLLVPGCLPVRPNFPSKAASSPLAKVFLLKLSIHEGLMTLGVFLLSGVFIPVRVYRVICSS